MKLISHFKGTALLLGALLFASVSLYNSTDVHAAIAPDSCFDFNTGTGTILNYYDTEGDIPGNPECPLDLDIPSTIDGSPVLIIAAVAFKSESDHLTSVTIPNTVTEIRQEAFAENNLTSVVIGNSVVSIGDNAFSENNLTSVIIPDSVTSLGEGAFRSNYLTSVVLSNSITILPQFAFAINNLSSVTIPNSVTTIDTNAFAANSLTSVVIPDSVTSLGQEVFISQSPLGREWIGEVLESGDTARAQAAMDQTRYLRIYTESPNNPNSLADELVTEAIFGNDFNGDGDMTDSFGGHIINPANITVSYQAEGGEALSPDATYTGAGLASYLVSQNLDDDLSLYYRLGESYEISPLSFSGYQDLSNQTVLMNDLDNSYTFIYAALAGQGDSTSGEASGGSSLAGTGVSQLALLVLPIALISGLVILNKRTVLNRYY